MAKSAKRQLTTVRATTEPEVQPEVQGGDDWSMTKQGQGWRQCQHCKAYSKGARSLNCKNPSCQQPFPQKQTRQTTMASGSTGVVQILMKRIEEIDSILENLEGLKEERNKLQETLAIYEVDEEA